MLRELIAPPVLAVQFLTALPLPVSVPAGARQLGRSLIFFPLVGSVLGLLLAALDAALLVLLPLPVATALVLIAGTLLTGGLHLDGLMDTCDGVFGGRTRERRLEIMRDSRVGSYGVLAGALQLLLKYAALVCLPPELRGAALVAALTGGRWVMVCSIRGLPYARPEGLGRLYKEGVRTSDVLLALLLAMALGWAALSVWGPALLLAGALPALLGAWWLARQLGGLTGDTYGALNELAEASVLVGLLALVTRAP